MLFDLLIILEVLYIMDSVITVHNSSIIAFYLILMYNATIAIEFY